MELKEVELTHLGPQTSEIIKQIFPPLDYFSQVFLTVVMKSPNNTDTIQILRMHDLKHYIWDDNNQIISHKFLLYQG